MADLTLMAPDEKPETSNDHPCGTCGVEVVRRGNKGRWPKFCEQHTASHKAGRGSGARIGNATLLAAQATEALCQVNGLIAMGLMLAQMPETGSALAEREDVFREQAYAALLTDPALSKVILRAGTTSGRISLGIAYVMLTASVAPVGVMEFKQNRENRAEDSPLEDRSEVA